MMPVAQPQSHLVAANQALRSGEFSAAMVGHVAAMLQMPEIGATLALNVARTRRNYLASRRSADKPHVVTCGWSLSHNAAGRVHTIAQIYQEFAEVEIIGCLFPNLGREIWEPLLGSPIPIHPILVEDPNHIIHQALELVAAHPADIFHLSKPRGPNILFGILYKILWGAQVILDIDDEELAFAQAETPVTTTEYLAQHHALPPLDQITQTDWTRLAVGLTDAFDAITVSNAALQERYGGKIIGHARNPKSLTPSPALRQASRQVFGIRPEQKVVLFSGTPRPHKGLLEVAGAIQSLKRPDILFVIAGSFGQNHLGFKAKLQAVTGVNYLFLENQPLNALPRTLAIADCCVLFQDTQNLCATFQTPAKLSDALGMSIPVIATATLALAEPIAVGAILPATTDNLARQLTITLDQRNTTQIDAGQRYFSENLSLAANAQRLQHLINDTQASVLSPTLKLICRELARHAPVLNQLQPQQLYHHGKLAIAVHVYYPEIWPEIAQRLKAFAQPFVLDITTPPDLANAVKEAVKRDFPAARIHPTHNQGMDILPFLSLVPLWQHEGILAVCKLHTKKGDDDGIAIQWRKHLLDMLVGHPDIPAQIAHAFAENPQLSLVGPAALYLSGQRPMYNNQAALEQLNQALHHSPLPQSDWGFFAGTMFWARPAALAPMAKLAGLAPSTVPDTSHQDIKDGQREHALEHLFGLIPHYFEIGDGQIGLLHSPTSGNEVPAIQIIQAKSSTARQHIQPSHATQAVRNTLARIDWPAQQSKQRNPKLISIIIPVYNQPELTAACFASLYQHTDTKTFELILVDNGSNPLTQALLQELANQHLNVRLLRNPENRNFATGCNQGFAASQGEIVVFLNNDTTLTPHWLAPLVEALRHPGVAAVQPKLLYPDGSIQCIGVVFSDKSPLGYPIYAGLKPEMPWATRSRSFQAVTGACMALRARDFAALQGFDPIYINGQEDIDLCLRLNQHHGRPCGWVATESTVIHHESKTAKRYQYVECNRSNFVRRWIDQVKPDDLDYYAADGFSVVNYQPGSPNTMPDELQVYRPQLILSSTLTFLTQSVS